MDNFPPEEIAYQTAHINEDRSVLVVAVFSVFLGVAILSLILRIIARRVGNSKLALDDYLSIGATVALIGVTISACYDAYYGIGRHLLYVAQTPKNFIMIGKATLAMSVCYPWSIALAKLSVLSLFARIFTMSSRTVRIGVYFFTVYTILWWISLIFLVFFQCRPLSSNWGIPSQCHVSFTASVSTGVLNAISDIGILALPQPAIWKLQLSLSKKLALSLVFLTGGFATVISIVRIPLLEGANTGAELDLTYTAVNGFLFTVMEPACVVICGCLPMLPGLYKRLRKPIPKSTTTGSYGRLADSRQKNGIRMTTGISQVFRLSKQKSGVQTSGLESGLESTDAFELTHSIGRSSPRGDFEL